MTKNEFLCPEKNLDKILDLISQSLKAGADSADAIVGSGTAISASCRLGKLEDFQRSENWELGLRVLVGKRQAIVSTSDPSEKSIKKLIGILICLL